MYMYVIIFSYKSTPDLNKTNMFVIHVLVSSPCIYSYVLKTQQKYSQILKKKLYIKRYYSEIMLTKVQLSLYFIFEERYITQA